MQVTHDEAGNVIAVTMHGTRYSPEALSRMAAEVERMRPVVEAAGGMADAEQTKAGHGAQSWDVTVWIAENCRAAMLDLIAAVAAYREGAKSPAPSKPGKSPPGKWVYISRRRAFELVINGVHEAEVCYPEGKGPFTWALFGRPDVRGTHDSLYGAQRAVRKAMRGQQ